jgi:hypothetical protein
LAAVAGALSGYVCAAIVRALAEVF